MPIALSDFVDFSERTLEGMSRVLDRLDDVSVNARPSIPDASSPFQLATHALGAFAWWTSHMVCGRPVDRDRDAEFEASGTLAELHAALGRARDELDAIVPQLATASKLHGEPRTQIPLGRPWTVGACLMHAYEELAQHLGHLEMTVDVLLRADGTYTGGADRREPEHGAQIGAGTEGVDRVSRRAESLGRRFSLRLQPRGPSGPRSDQ